MEDDLVEDLARLVPPLLQALDGLEYVGRHLHPGELPALLAAVEGPEDLLPDALAPLKDWPESLADPRAALEAAADQVLAAWRGLRAAETGGDPRGAWRALRALPRAQSALYPLAAGLPPVSRWFLEPSCRGDAGLVRRLAEGAANAQTGVFHLDNPHGQRGGASLYVPETYDPATPAPLVVALHGGSGNGAAFLWSWLRAARSAGAILLAPTALGDTWAITGPDPDSPHLAGMVERLASLYALDPARRLLTGMSDGGTFSYTSGLEPGSPFTHLAPVSAAFHPMLAQFGAGDRLAGLPIHIVHGARDWMFPVDMAREARDALESGGARVAYLEIGDLSHTFPREVCAGILDWLGPAAG